MTPDQQRILELEKQCATQAANYQRECAKRARAERDSEKYRRITVQDQKTIEQLQRKIRKLEKDPASYVFRDLGSDE